jgi:hypothetical protein
MTAWLIGAVTLILVVLIIGRRSSKDFRRKSEEPKYQFLANIGVDAEEVEQQERQEEAIASSTPKKESKHESHKS